MDTVIQATELAGSHADLSMWGMFVQSDILTKIVMLVLFAASVWSWAIIIDKYMTFKNIRSKTSKFESAFWSGESLEKLYNRIKSKANDPMSRIFCAGMHEWKLSMENSSSNFDGNLKVGLQQRIERAMATSINREMNTLEKYLSFLGTVSATAPFLGLFGTVWGIMNSFSAIAEAQNASLVVVAPGIAEALSTTAVGLIAAIPAAIAYNKFSTDLGRYGDRLDGFASDFISIISRHFDQQDVGQE